MNVDKDSNQNVDLALMNTSALAFIGGFCPHAMRIKTSCDGRDLTTFLKLGPGSC